MLTQRVIVRVGRGRHVPYAGLVSAEIDRAAWARVVTQLVQQESAGNKTRFAAAIGVDRKTVTRWVQGDHAVSEESVRAVARALGLPARDLLIQVGYYKATDLPAVVAEARIAEEDAAIKLIRESNAPPSLKAELIAHLERLREEHERQRLAEAERSLKLGMRGRRNVG